MNLARSVALFVLVAATAALFVGCDADTAAKKKDAGPSGHDSRVKHSANVIELTDANWQKEVVESNVPVLVDFWAPWCGPCVALGPTIDKLADKYKGRIKVGKLNVDDAERIASAYKIRSIPCVMVFKGGDQPREKFVGVQPEAVYAQALDSMLSAN